MPTPVLFLRVFRSFVLTCCIAPTRPISNVSASRVIHCIIHSIMNNFHSLRLIGLLSALISISPIFAIAQQTRDSLHRVLNDHPAADSVRVDLLYEISFEYWRSDPSRAEQYARQALQLAQELDYLPGKGKAYSAIGIAHWARGTYSTALENFLQSLTLWETLNQPQRVASTLGNIGMVYDEIGEHRRALAYQYRAYQLYQRLGEQEHWADAANNLGALYFEQARYDSAEHLFREALLLRRALPDTFKLATSYNNLGEIYAQQDSLDQAIDLYQQAMQLWEAVGGENGKAMTLGNLGNAYLRLGDYSSAERSLQQALTIAQEIDAKNWAIQALQHLKAMETQRGRYQKALEYDQLYDTLKDSLFSSEKTQQMALLQHSYEQAKQEKELAQLKQQQAEFRAHWMTVAAVLVALILLSGSMLIYQRIKRKREHWRRALAEAELENTRLKERQLTQTLDHRNRELTSYAINFIQKNELMEELKINLSTLGKKADGEVRRQLQSLNRMVDSRVAIDRDWEEFKRHFEQVHPDFFATLLERYPELSPSEHRLCALLRLGMNVKESASILNIAPESVKMARYRLRKKLNLSTEDNLTQFLRQVDRREVST